MGSRPTIGGLRASAYRIPTEGPEADGTLAWTSTTLVVAEVQAGGHSGIGYTYSDAAAAQLINGKLRDAVIGIDATAIP